MSTVSHFAPFAQVPRSENSHNVGEGAETVNVRRGPGRPERELPERLAPDDVSKRSRTFDEAIHNPLLPLGLPVDASIDDVIHMAVKRAMLDGMSARDGDHARIIMRAGADDAGGRIVTLSQPALLALLQDTLGDKCRVASVNGLRMMERRLVDHGLVWHADMLDVAPDGSVVPALGGRRGLDSGSGLDLAPSIIGYETNLLRVEAHEEAGEREAERKRLRMSVLHAINAIYGSADKLRRSPVASDQAKGEVLRLQAVAYGARRLDLWESGTVADLAELLDEVVAATPRSMASIARNAVASVQDFSKGGCQRISVRGTPHNNAWTPHEKCPTPPSYRDLQATATDARSGQSAGHFVESRACARTHESETAIDETAMQGIAIKHSQPRLTGHERSCPPMSSRGAAANHNLSVSKASIDRALGEMVAAGRAMGADGEADDGNEQESRSARGPRVAMSVPEALATPAGCRGLLAVMPSLAAAAGRVEVVGPADLVAAAERLIETWDNPAIVNGQPLNLKSVARSREKLIEVRGATDAAVGEWLLAVAMAANAKGLKKTREALATGILTNIRDGRFDASRFPTRDFWEATQAAGGTAATVAAVDEARPAQTAEIIPLAPKAKVVEVAVEEIVQAPAPAKVVAVPSAEAPRRPVAAVPSRAPVTVDKMSSSDLLERFAALRADRVALPAGKGPGILVAPAVETVIETAAVVEPKIAVKAAVKAAAPAMSAETLARVAALKAKCGLGGKPLPLPPVAVSLALPMVDEDTVLPPRLCDDDLALDAFRDDQDDQDGEAWDDGEDDCPF